MSRQAPHAPLTLAAAPVPADAPVQPPELGRLDLLARMPIPLRRPFKAGLDRVVGAHRDATGTRLDCCFLAGGEWYRPFDGLARASAAGDALPGMLVSHLDHDIMGPVLLDRYAPAAGPRPRTDWHPACQAAGLADPRGVFRVFAVIPFVFLVDERRLQGRPAPRAWEDLFDPVWRGDIVFGGWRPHDRVPYQDYNNYLMFALDQEYGAAGLDAFAANVAHLQHNIRTATQAGSNSPTQRAIAILPWLQAELCPRRDRTRVLWPADGALTLPIGYLVQPAAEQNLAPLVDYLTGPELGAVLARNCYPPAAAAVAGAFPEGARLKWPGWERLYGQDLAAAYRCAAARFFAARGRGAEVRACG
jgi:ABC-type Fe3+ transport system substrate-binding protein